MFHGEKNQWKKHSHSGEIIHTAIFHEIQVFDGFCCSKDLDLDLPSLPSWLKSTSPPWWTEDRLNAKIMELSGSVINDFTLELTQLKA